MKLNKKGDISINVIIVTVIALIVLVFLILIFTGRIGIFKAGVSKTAELAPFKADYGDCRPTGTDENSFVKEVETAPDDAAKEAARAKFEQRVGGCKVNPDQSSCTSAGCKWK